jgi:hypothetical protein
MKDNTRRLFMTAPLVARPPATRGAALAPIAALAAPDGVYYVTGNHEYLHGAASRGEFMPKIPCFVWRISDGIRGTQGRVDVAPSPNG